MSYGLSNDSNAQLEDEILDAVRSGAEPDTILGLLDTALAERYTSRKENRKLEKKSFFNKVTDFCRGNKNDLPDPTEKTLRSAIYFMRKKDQWDPRTKLFYIKNKLSFVLDRNPTRGFLSQLKRALELYLNPNQPNIWKQLEKSDKKIKKEKARSKSLNENQFDFGESVNDYNDLNDDDNYETNEPLLTEKYRKKRKNSFNKSRKKNSRELNFNDNEDDEDDYDVVKEIDEKERNQLIEDDDEEEENIKYARSKSYKIPNRRKNMEIQRKSKIKDDDNDIHEDNGSVDRVKRHERIRKESDNDNEDLDDFDDDDDNDKTNDDQRDEKKKTDTTLNKSQPPAKEKSQPETKEEIKKEDTEKSNRPAEEKEKTEKIEKSEDNTKTEDKNKDKDVKS